MSTLRVQSLAPLGGFAYVFSLLNIFLGAFLDAQREAAIAHKRYPFAEW
jgi:hypothetical protein